MCRLRGKRFRWLLQIGGVELAQISRHALIDLRKSALHLCAGEILVAIIDRLELAAVDRDARLREQAQLSAKGDELGANLAYCSSVVLAEIGDRLVVGSEPPEQPHDLNVASGLTFESAARLNPIEVAVDVELH